MNPVVVHHSADAPLHSRKDYKFFSTGHCSIEEIPGHEHRRELRNGHDHCGKLAALGFVYGYGVGQVQLLHIDGIIYYKLVVKLDCNCVFLFVDGYDFSHISVENTFSCLEVHIAPPLQAVVVLGLHDLVPFTEDDPANLALGFFI